MISKNYNIQWLKMVSHLISHPQTPCHWVDRLDCDVIWKTSDSLQLCYQLVGALDQLIIPPVTTPSTLQDNLWQRTCFEVFIMLEGESAYTEFNISPSGEWAVYYFSDYRKRTSKKISQAPEIKRMSSSDSIEMTVLLSPLHLPYNPNKKTVRLGLSTVIETQDHQHAYWALNHPCEQADFHHIESFSLPLTPST